MLDISHTRKSTLIWNFFAFVLATIIYSTYFYAPKFYLWLATEDALGENLTALLYGVSGFLIIIHCLRKNKRNASSWRTAILPLLLGIFFILVAGEEISWGQRILGISTPDVIRDRNIQGEMNFHNLTFFDKNASLLDQHRALNLFALLFGIVFPLGYFFVRRIRILFNSVNFPISPLACCGFFVFGLLQSQTIAKLYIHWSHTEVKELVFSFGVFFFAISQFRNQNKLPDNRTT